MLFSKKQLILSSAISPLVLVATQASAAPIYGTTPFSNTTAGGYAASTSAIASGGPISVSSGGYEVGNASYYQTITSPPANGRYTTGFILTPSGTNNLGTFSGALTTSNAVPTIASSINTNGTLVAGISNSDTSVSTSSPNGLAAVWSNNGNPVALLPAPYTDASNDSPKITTDFINNFGTVVGKGVAYNSSKTVIGNPASFVWVNSGSVASPTYSSYSELLPVSSASAGAFSSTVNGISDNATQALAVGSGSTYNSSGTFTGSVAVTWNTSSTPTASTSSSTPQSTIAAVQLVNPTLPTDGRFGGVGPYTYNSAGGTISAGGTAAVSTNTSIAQYVNPSNVIAGSASVYDGGTESSATTGTFKLAGTEPIVWRGAGSTGTFLPLATNYTMGNVTGINTGSDVVGNIQGTGIASGVLWKLGASSPTMLNLPTGTNPITNAAYAGFTFSKGVNDSDYSVGFLASATNLTTGYAMVWDPNGTATDLDTLVPLVTNLNGTTAGWVSLLIADGISNDGYISGVGEYYDPNATNYSGAGLSGGDYYRPFEILDTAAAPEPTSLAFAALIASPGLLLRRRKQVVDSL